MRAIIISEPGDPDVLTLAEVDEPTLGPNDVLIDVTAAGLNRADLQQRKGLYPPPPGAPEWPGMEVSGTVAALGPDAEGSGDADDGSGLAIGDRVVALLGGGGYAERVAVDAGLVLPLPAGIDLVEAAGLPEAVMTVWSNVFLNAQLAEGETFLVHGGTSGIGSVAIQMARAAGARVFATAGSAAKTTFCEELGAERGIDYHRDDFVEIVREATDGAGVDVVLDLVGGDYLARNVEAIGMGGRIMVIANQSGTPSTFDLGALMAKRGRIWATTLRSRPLIEKVEIVQSAGETVWPWIEAGLVHPVIDEVLPLDRAADAHRRMEAGGHTGKLLLAL